MGHHQLQSLLGSPSTHAHMVATVAARLTATARMATTSIGGKFALEVLSTESKAGAARVPLWTSSMAVVAMVVAATGLTVVQASRSPGTNSGVVHLLTRSGSSARTSEARILHH